MGVKKLKILHIVTEMNYGGWESYIMNIFRKIDLSKYEFYFLVFRKRIGYFEDEISKLGGKVFHLSFGEDYKYFKFKKDLKSLMENNHFDIAHCHQRHYSIFYLPIIKKYIKTIIIHSHTANRSKNFQGYLVWKLGQYPAKKGYHNLACSKLAGEFVFGKEPYTFCPNCIDSTKFKFDEKVREELRREYNIPNDSVVLGHIGRFAPPKNHSFLLEIFKKLVKKESDKKYILCLCGEGALKSQILDDINNDPNIKNRVIVLKSGETSGYYSLFDYFVLPSTHEGFPLVLLESQAAGCLSFASNNITKEALLSKHLEYLDIDSSEKWVETLLKANPLSIEERSKSYLDIKQTIYDSENAVNFLTDYYNKCIEEDKND